MGVKVNSRSLTVVSFDIVYGFLVVFCSNFVPKMHRFRDIRLQISQKRHEMEPYLNLNVDRPQTWVPRSQQFWSRISRNRCILGTKLLQNTTRKPYTISNDTTVNDLELNCRKINRKSHFSTPRLFCTPAEGVRFRMGYRLLGSEKWNLEATSPRNPSGYNTQTWRTGLTDGQTDIGRKPLHNAIDTAVHNTKGNSWKKCLNNNNITNTTTLPIQKYNRKLIRC